MLASRNRIRVADDIKVAELCREKYFNFVLKYLIRYGQEPKVQILGVRLCGGALVGAGRLRCAVKRNTCALCFEVMNYRSLEYLNPFCLPWGLGIMAILA